MRWLIIGGILALVVTVYALVDLTVTDDRRVRRLNRVLWVVLIVVLPVFGAIGWLAWGKGARADARPMAPDDDPSFSRSSDVTDEEADIRIAELEAQLAALDDEDFEGGPAASGPVLGPEPKPEPPAKPEPKATEPKATPKPRSKPKADAPEGTQDDVDGQGHRAPGDGGDSARA
ncbi:PLDc N-terminal domain-containing protein [Agrococcus sp. ARC_14]|uniref:PLDc N-terminal domain-containing protein n=1 Tax=Agrococcus sp. ARC_14 TaxID=2919927 RepID=UPI001F05B8BC|nr:PLDc N-terminal domain-containing protein [Agrococcus sp. ARC_14]MCH1882130.1 PLDc N-terminal domain-containing protein [Agrococcus sp. ARC_14]